MAFVNFNRWQDLNAEEAERMGRNALGGARDALQQGDAAIAATAAGGPGFAVNPNDAKAKALRSMSGMGMSGMQPQQGALTGGGALRGDAGSAVNAAASKAKDLHSMGGIQANQSFQGRSAGGGDFDAALAAGSKTMGNAYTQMGDYQKRMQNAQQQGQAVRDQQAADQRAAQKKALMGMQGEQLGDAPGDVSDEEIESAYQAWQTALRSGSADAGELRKRYFEAQEKRRRAREYQNKKSGTQDSAYQDAASNDESIAESQMNWNEGLR